MTKNNLIIGGALENMEVWILSICMWSASKLHETLRQEHEEEAEASPRTPTQQKSNEVTTFETYVLAYCFLATLVHIFWEGEYVVFHSWLLPGGDGQSNEWFLAGWRAYMQADERYGKED